MSRTLVVIVSANGEKTLWGLFENDALQETGCGALHDLPAADTVWGVVPGTEVVAHPVSLPAKSESKARAALPYLMEEDLAQPVETLHFALGRYREENRWAGAVARERMDLWMAAFREAGIQPDGLFPDFLAIGETPVVIERPETTIAFLGDSGFAVEPDLARHILAAREDPPAPRRMDDGEFVQTLMAGITAGPPLDLLQGAYAIKRRGAVNFAVWRRTAALAGMAAALYLAVLGGEAWWYSHRAAVVDQQSKALFRDVFPDVERVVDPHAQMQARLSKLRADSAERFLRLSRLLFTGLQARDGVAVRALRYDSKRRTLNAELAYTAFADLQAVKTAIGEAGGTLEEGGSRQSGGRMIGDVTVSVK